MFETPPKLENTMKIADFKRVLPIFNLILEAHLASSHRCDPPTSTSSTGGLEMPWYLKEVARNLFLQSTSSIGSPLNWSSNALLASLTALPATWNNDIFRGALTSSEKIHEFTRIHFLHDDFQAVKIAQVALLILTIQCLELTSKCFSTFYQTFLSFPGERTSFIPCLGFHTPAPGWHESGLVCVTILTCSNRKWICRVHHFTVQVSLLQYNTYVWFLAACLRMPRTSF